MLTSIRGLTAAAILTAFASTAAPAFAQDEEAAETGGITITGSATLVSDYRFRGVSLSGGDPAIQGGVTATHDSGFYVGTWGSSIDDGGTDVYGDVEIDLFGGWSGNLTEGLALDIGALYYAYPSNAKGVNAEYLEPYATLSTTLGPVQAKFGANYAIDNAALAGDSLYLHTELAAGIPQTPVTLNAHLGYTDGVLAPTLLGAPFTDDTAFDWSVGASATVLGSLTLGVAYTGVEGPSIKDYTDDAIVFSIGASF